MSLISKILAKFGYVKKDLLNYGLSIEDRLEKHREFVENLEKDNFFEACPYLLENMANQDDYLIYLFFLTYGKYPDSNNYDYLVKFKKSGGYAVYATKLNHCVRNRPKILDSINK